MRFRNDSLSLSLFNKNINLLISVYVYILPGSLKNDTNLSAGKFLFSLTHSLILSLSLSFSLHDSFPG